MDLTSTSGRRSAAGLMIAIGAVGIALNWWFSESKNHYYPKLAVIAPLVLTIGVAFLCFPNIAGKAERGESGKVAAQIAMVVAGAGLGVLNLWLLSHA